jgi:hypothetical protein
VELAALAGRDPMIDPQLQDWWSQQRLTQLNYHNLSLSGAGVSLQVILQAFKNSGVVWYSRIYGDYQDNVLLLAAFPTAELLSERVRYTEQSPIQKLCGNIFSDALIEYVLTDTIASELGIRFEGDDFFVERQDRFENKVVWQIYIHDNCFFHIEPLGSELLGRIVNCVLEQHSFYLGQEIDWSEISAALHRQLLASGKIEIQSDPKRQNLWIPQLVRKKVSSWISFPVWPRYSGY